MDATYLFFLIFATAAVAAVKDDDGDENDDDDDDDDDLILQTSLKSVMLHNYSLIDALSDSRSHCMLRLECHC